MTSSPGHVAKGTEKSATPVARCSCLARGMIKATRLAGPIQHGLTPNGFWSSVQGRKEIGMGGGPTLRTDQPAVGALLFDREESGAARARTNSSESQVTKKLF